MRPLIFLLFALPLCQLQAQVGKPPLKPGQTLPFISEECISPDGRYVLYKTNSEASFLTLFDQEKQKSISFPYYGWNLAFDAGSTRAIFRTGSDSLAFIQLPSGDISFTDSVQDLQLKDYEGSTWARINYSGAAVELRNFSTEKSFRVADISRVQFFKNRPLALLLQGKPGINTTLLLLDLQTGVADKIWTGNSCFQIAISRNEKAIAFSCQDTRSEQRSIRTYDLSTKHIAEAASENDELLISKNVRIHQEGMIRFANVDSCILFSCKVEPVVKPSFDGLSIYRYNEDQSWKLINTDGVSFMSVNRFNGNRFVVTEKDELFNHSTVSNDLEKIIVKRSPAVSVFGMDWVEGKFPALLLTSLVTGMSDTICARAFTDEIVVSQDNRFVVYYDRGMRAYFSYDIHRRISKNISDGIPFPMYRNEDLPAPPPSHGIAAWNRSKGTILVYDEYDIWEVDYTGNAQPINLTQGYGRKYHQVMRLLKFEHDDRFAVPVLDDSKTYYLNSVDLFTRQQSFYLIHGLKKQEPTRLFHGDVTVSRIMKAKTADQYLMRQETASKTPNLFLSKDLIIAQQISYLNASEGVNWMTAELITMEGRQGVLYKPENFDPQQKYPLIFSVYDRYSERFHEYLFPKIQGSILDIPFYVSNGYCVFVPDLYYTVGEPGFSASSQIVQWVDTLCKRAYFDPARIGIQGHSWGGYEVNFTITQTNRFAAAVAASGPSDLVSNVNAGGFSFEITEFGQSRIGKPFFAAPELYIRNSPVYLAGHVSTPLLLMTGTDDFNVPAFQSKEMFYALKRKSKKVWMLEYANDAHSLNDVNGKDFDCRTFQFFNHYLKGESVPDWF